MTRAPRPIRSCVACRTSRPRQGLVRFVADERGRLRPDPGQRQPGRGVYTCATEACIHRAASKGGFARGLKRRVAKMDPTSLMATTAIAVEEEYRSLLEQGRRDGRAAARSPRQGRNDREVVAGSGWVVKDPRLGRRVAALSEQAARLGVKALAANGEVRV